MSDTIFLYLGGVEALPQNLLKMVSLNGAFGAVHENIMKVKIRSKCEGLAQKRGNMTQKRLNIVCVLYFFFSNIKGDLCSLMWAGLCQTLP